MALKNGFGAASSSVLVDGDTLDCPIQITTIALDWRVCL